MLRVQITPLLTLSVEGGRLDMIERSEAMLVYQADRVYSGSPLLQSATSEWSDAYWAALDKQEDTKEPFVLRVEGGMLCLVGSLGDSTESSL